MAKVLKKFLALVLVLAVVMSMTGMTAFAMDDDETIVETEAAPVEEAAVEENDKAPVDDETPAEEAAPVEEEAPAEEETPAEEDVILDEVEDETEEDEGTETDAVVFLDGEGYPTFHAAVDAANEKGGGTIVVPEGTTVYVTEGGTAPVRVLSTITITGGGTVKRGEGCTGCVIHVGNVMSMTSTGNLTLENITIDGGAIWTGDVDPVLGRGTVNEGLTSTQAMIRVDGMESSLILRDGAVLQNNHDVSTNVGVCAGAVKVDYGATLEMYEGAVIRNNAGSLGGAIKFDYVSRVPVIAGGEIYGNASNLTSKDEGGYGGAIALDSYLDLSNVTIRNNWAAKGGGAIYSWKVADDPDNPGVLNIHEGTVIRDNVAEDRGGGVFISSGTVTIDGGSISDNTGKGGYGGGGVYVYDGTVTIDGGNITGNTSNGKYGGGGVYINSGTVTINDGNISDNTADGEVSCGGGVFIMTGTLTINGGNISDNTAGVRGGGITMWGNSNSTTTVEITGGIVGENNAPSLPCFAVNKNYSSLTLFGGTFAREVDAYVAEAYKAVDNGDGTWTVIVDEETAVAQIVGGLAYTSLQKAIDAAEDGDTVVLLKDVEADAFIDVNKSITIEGGNHKVTSTASRILRVTVNDVTVTLNDIEFISTKAERGVQVDSGKTGVELNINGCTVPGTYYAVNMCGDTSVALNINDSTISGWGALNLWGSNYEVKVSNSTLIGHNDKGYSEAGWNGFGVVVLEGDTTGQTDEHVSNCHVVLEDCHIIASTAVNADGNANIQKVILFNNPSTSNTVEITGNKTVVEYEQGELTPFCAQNGSENTITISGGIFSSEVELSHCAEGYLPVANADGTYGVVEHTPTITANPENMTGAGTVTLTVNVPSNLSAEVEVTGKDVTGSGEEVTVTPNGDNTYTVSLPNTTATYVFRVDIGDIFKGEGVIPPTCVVNVTRYVAPSTPVTPSEPDETDEPTVEIDDEGTALADRPFLFEDVLEDDWFYGDVKNIFENGLINGTTTTTYEPQTELSRGMIVTILWRIAGEPTVETTSTFADVPENAYYFNAINWGAENSIARGYDEDTFAPDKLVSREELAAFIYRYAELIELDLTEIDEDALAEFSDADSVQDFAITAMKWAVSAGIIKGDDGMLKPQDSATRAEAAAMINRFIQLPEVAAVMEANAETEGENENETEAE